MVRIIKPTTAGRRGMKVLDFASVLTAKSPVKKLIKGSKRSSGRNNRGVVTSEHRGGGVKQRLRAVDFKQRKFGIPGIIKSIEYDPKRTAFIAHIVFTDGEQNYILAPEGISLGDKIIYGPSTKIKLGNRLQFKNIPAGTTVHNIEITPGKGGQIVRSAGGSATVMGFDGSYALIKLPSGEVRKVLDTNFASIGAVSNTDHMNIKIGKAGRSRWLGRRPNVRGKAKNPVDHPHGGGEGGSPIGLKHPKTPTGKPARGLKTRNRKKMSNKLIVKPRTKKRR
ncbi:MAG: 50S ribosomal protein L2 [Patescibacteria group bacterium]|nr:50S ribosomal protein L2 [Patescibacteria group bacterium]